MNCLYELTLKHRELIESKLAELCIEEADTKYGCTSVEDCRSILNLLSSLFFVLLCNSKDYRKPGKKLNLSQIIHPGKLEEFQRLRAKGNDYKVFFEILNDIKNVYRDIIFLKAKDTTELYNCILQNDKSFECLQMVIYNQWNTSEGNDIILRKIEELKKQAYESMKLLNETLEYDKVKTEFFANLSHELRTPLNVILGTLQVMDMFNFQDGNFTNEKMKRYSKIMRQNCYRLLRLVNNLIDLNKLDSGYMSLNTDNYDIVSIISKIASSVSDYIENKGIHFSFETNIDSKIIACDPDKMERIILNLLSNAVKFTGNGGKIRVKLWEEKDKLFIAVRDTGVGIPKEKQDLVFKRFVQIDKSLSRVHQGSGIGLSLVKSLVELHGGSISFVSAAEAGCEFIIELPIKQAIAIEKEMQNAQYAENNRIEIINIEFADIYSQ